MRLFFKCRETDTFIFSLSFPDPVTSLYTHCNLSFNQTNAISANKRGIAHRGCLLRWQYGLRQTKWRMPDCETSSFFQPLQKPSVDVVSGCLSLACWHVSMETCKRCHKADLDHYTHLPADQRCSPQFQWGFGWYERASSPCQSPLEWQTVFVLFAALLLSGCLCLADVDKCLGLVCLRRRDSYVSSCDFVCQPQKA